MIDLVLQMLLVPWPALEGDIDTDAVRVTNPGISGKGAELKIAWLASPFIPDRLLQSQGTSLNKGVLDSLLLGLFEIQLSGRG